MIVNNTDTLVTDSTFGFIIEFARVKQIAKIAVGDDQNPALFPGDFKDVLIGETWGIVTRDGLDVMSKLAKVRNKSEVGALVEEEFHRAASARPPSRGFGETSSPVTSA